MIDKPDLEAILVKWQKILRLQDWDVKIYLNRAFDLPDGKQGMCRSCISKKSAIVKVLDPSDYDPNIPWPQDIEQTVVHELLHLHCSLFDDDFKGGDVMLEEHMINALAEALVALDRRSIPPVAAV